MSMNKGDTLAIEVIRTQISRIFYLTNKKKCVEIMILQIGKTFLNINYSKLQEIRIYTAYVLNENLEEQKITCPTNLLDKVIENFM